MKKADKVKGAGASGTQRKETAASRRDERRIAVTTSVKDRDKRFGAVRDEPRAGKGKAGREDVRREARRVNVPRQSLRPGERGR